MTLACRRHGRATVAGMDRTESGLQWMRRLTQWTLISVAGLVVAIPAGDLFLRDDRRAARAAALRL